MYRMWYGKNNWSIVDKETWKTGIDHDKMGKLIKYNMHVQASLWKKTFSSNAKKFTVLSMNGSF